MTGAHSQIHEIGVFVGGSNYVGDIGKTTYVAPNEPALGVLYKWNRSPRHSYRFSYIQSNIKANDLDSEEGSRNQRGYNFENDMKELSAGLEFDFFDFNLHDTSVKVTPFVSFGLSYFFSKYTVNNPSNSATVEGRIEKNKSIALPIIVGIKSNIAPHFILGLEAGARYTLTDNLDGSFNQNFGNINNNDWYVFSGVTLTYTFGNKPCYCAN